MAEIQEEGRDPYYVFNQPYRFIGTDRPATADAPPALGSDTDEVIASVLQGEWDTERKVS